MKSKKVLISEDAQGFKATMENVNEVIIPAVREVISLIKDMKVGPVTYDLTVDAIFLNSAKIGGMFREIAEKQAKDIDNPVLIRSLQTGFGEVITAFRKNVEAALFNCDKSLLSNIQIENEEPVLKEDYLENVREMHRVYANSQAEADMYFLHKKAATVLNELFVNVRSTLTVFDIQKVFEIKNDLIVPNQFTQYEYFLKKENAVSE